MSFLFQKQTISLSIKVYCTQVKNPIVKYRLIGRIKRFHVVRAFIKRHGRLENCYRTNIRLLRSGRESRNERITLRSALRVAKRRAMLGMRQLEKKRQLTTRGTHCSSFSRPSSLVYLSHQRQPASGGTIQRALAKSCQTKRERTNEKYSVYRAKRIELAESNASPCFLIFSCITEMILNYFSQVKINNLSI